MAATPSSSPQKSAGAMQRDAWLRKHADYQRVYREGKRQSLPLMTYFFAARTVVVAVGPRIGLTAGKVLGNAVARNRIKRRMREAVRLHRAELTAAVDIILHPRRAVLEVEFAQIERDVVRALRAVQASSKSPAKAAEPDLSHVK